jgi:hypothetical protein
MNFLWKKIGTYKILMLSTPFLIYFAADFSMEYMAEYSKKGLCYSTNSVLSEQELRERTIRNWLKAQIKDARENNNKYILKTFLILGSMSSEDVISSIKSKSIMNMQDLAIYQLEEPNDVDKIEPKFLQGEFSFIKHYMYEYIVITPSKSIQLTNSLDVKRQFSNYKIYVADHDRQYVITELDKVIGFGNYFFKVYQYSFSLGYSRKDYAKEIINNDGIYPEQYSKEIINDIKLGKEPSSSHIIVSNCGSVLYKRIQSPTDSSEMLIFNF